MTAHRQPRVAYVFIYYPTLTQTFLQREIEALARQEIRVQVHSLLTGGEPAGAVQPPAGEAVDYFRWYEAIKLPVALVRELWRQPSIVASVGRWLRGYRWDGAENFWLSVWAAVFAVVRADRIRRAGVDHVHGTWATGPATAAAILSRLCHLPFSFGAQAYDIYRHGGDGFLPDKLAAAAFVHTTTRANAEYLRGRARPGTLPHIILARRGLDRLPPIPDRSARSAPIRLLTVGRLVPKKGHQHLVTALAMLRDCGRDFTCRIIGTGPLQPAVRKQIAQCDLADRITLEGVCQPPDVSRAFDWADIYLHLGVIDPRGDRDGLPNAVAEAMAHRLPVICGDLPSVCEAVSDEVTGLVVTVTDPDAVAAAVERLAVDAALRERLGARGRDWVWQHFMIDLNIRPIADAMRATSTPDPRV